MEQGTGSTEQGTRNTEQGTRNTQQGFRRLRAWQKADDLACAVFQAVKRFHPEHVWLRSQICRAAVSVPANMAEGYTRGALRDYLRFLDIARGSLAEVEYYIHFLRRNTVLPAEELARLETLREEAGRLLFALTQSLREKDRDGGPWQRGTLREEQLEYLSVMEE